MEKESKWMHFAAKINKVTTRRLKFCMCFFIYCVITIGKYFISRQLLRNITEIEFFFEENKAGNLPTIIVPYMWSPDGSETRFQATDGWYAGPY